MEEWNEAQEHFCLKHKLIMTIYLRHTDPEEINNESYHRCKDKKMYIYFHELQVHCCSY